MQIKSQTTKTSASESGNDDQSLMKDQEGVRISDINSVIDDIKNTKVEEKAREARDRRTRELVEKEWVRVGDKYYKLVLRPDKHGRIQRIYAERQKSTLIDDLGRKALNWVKKYEGFCTVASHTNYQQEIHGFFNEYYKISHVPQAGNHETINKILEHVFGSHIEFILDYIQILYLRPTQRLPIILLESKEKNTGKSTFGTLLNIIFEDNSIKLGNSDFESDFNAIWVKRLCIIVDETSLEKKGIMQMIKRLSTETSKVTSNEKNKSQTQIDFIGKFIFMSNDEGKALPIEKGDPRFAVFKVPTFTEMGIPEDPNIEQKIIKQVPAFLSYLSSRTLCHSESGRMYFAPQAYHTNQLFAYYEGSQSYIAKAVREFITDAFSMFPDQDVLCYSLTDLIQQLSAGEYAKKCDRPFIRKALENDLSLTLGVKQRYEFFNLAAMEQGMENYHSESRNNRVYQFTREDFTGS